MEGAMRSEKIEELAAALAKAQGSIESATFDRENPHFRSKYASLASVINAGRKALSENGIAVSQLINDGELTTLLMHTSGQWLSSTTALPVTARPQEFGSALTYLRRYHMMSIICIGVDDDENDDDASAAEAAKLKMPRRTPPQPAPNIMRSPGYKLSTGPSHDPETGEVNEDDDTSARPSPAGPAATSSTLEAAGSTLSEKATATIQMMAREAAKRGREQFDIYFLGLPPEGKRIVTLMQPELAPILGPR
jgi:ERF superfamily